MLWIIFDRCSVAVRELSSHTVSHQSISQPEFQTTANHRQKEKKYSYKCSISQLKYAKVTIMNEFNSKNMLFIETLTKKNICH